MTNAGAYWLRRLSWLPPGWFKGLRVLISDGAAAAASIANRNETGVRVGPPFVPCAGEHDANWQTREIGIDSLSRHWYSLPLTRLDNDPPV